MQKRIQITTEEKVRWAPMLQRVWQGIGGDVLQAYGGEAATMRRSEVVEVVCDAGMLCQDDYGGECMTAEEYKVLCAWYGTPSFKQWVREVFPYALYGM